MSRPMAVTRSFPVREVRVLDRRGAISSQPAPIGEFFPPAGLPRDRVELADRQIIELLVGGDPIRRPLQSRDGARQS